MKRIAVLTSGGDAAGMNAAVRAVVRTGIPRGLEVFGIRRGFSGLLDDDMIRLGERGVGNILQRGGTWLGSARCDAFREESGRVQALDTLRARGIEGLIVIGGNGSQMGTVALAKRGFPVVGIASTIDNDLMGTDVSLGVDTALNVALDAADKLRVTASSHRRASILEVMGRDSGHLALMVGVAGGAEAIVLPEVETSAEDVATSIRGAYERGKNHALVIVAEGSPLHADELQRTLAPRQAELGFELRFTILGHVQRGGAPTAFDRLLGTRFGAKAVDALLEGAQGQLVGEIEGRVVTSPLVDVVDRTRPLDEELLRLAPILAR